MTPKPPQILLDPCGTPLELRGTQGWSLMSSPPTPAVLCLVLRGDPVVSGMREVLDLDGENGGEVLATPWTP